jgi:hypothetical protein
MRRDAFRIHMSNRKSTAAPQAFERLYDLSWCSMNNNGAKACATDLLIEIIRAQDSEFALFPTVFPDKN